MALTAQLIPSEKWHRHKNLLCKLSTSLCITLDGHLLGKFYIRDDLKTKQKEWHRTSFKLPPPSWPNSDSWKSDKSHQLMGPSLLKERMTNSSLIEVSESLIPYDFIVTSLGGNDSNDIWLHFFSLMPPLEDKKSICLNIPQLPLTILQPCPLPCSPLTW